ncbi:MAG: hypothetical protein F4Z15_01005 [Gammaproteobacteria bacterium]|nr:hypothetical protein [Gammaproteobacteria bacterium]MYD76453.1 hypothetical protein [Gammaproteobacteria bacterium]MYJ52420.1 hypothetical protein [Gammaproteobacteria bacterium]
MWYLILEIWFWLLVALAVGILFGWLVWGRRSLSAQERIEYRLMKSRSESVKLMQGSYRITPQDEGAENRLEKQKKRDGPLKARHL